MIGATRRAALAAGLGALVARPAAAAAGPTVRIAAGASGLPISPYVYGSNEIGTLDGGRPSAELDRAAGVAIRRFGGNLTTTYNWTNGASNAGKDWRHANGDFLGEALGIPPTRRHEPAAAIVMAHEASLAMGATTIVTLPLAGYVAADRDGEVAAAEAAPSRRFVPVRWEGRTPASAPINPTVADIPHLLARLVARFGPAGSPTGIRAYALDNEPGLWAETHPRIRPSPARIGDLIARSIAAARVVKAIDPDAWVVGPASWGATEMASFQNAPDWPRYRPYGSFLGAYLDAFREASEAAGLRLLDALDVHWYPFSVRGDLFRTENPALAPALLAAPRSLDEPGFREESWVSSALPVDEAGGLALPILPSLARLASRWFPGTRIAVTEFNYGGAGQVASGLALASALGRLGRSGTLMATHWGSLSGSLGEAYRLFRNCDGRGTRFGDLALPAAVSGAPDLAAFAATRSDRDGALSLVLLNASERTMEVDIVLDGPAVAGPLAAYGFEAGRPALGPVEAPPVLRPGAPLRLLLPSRSARHYVAGLATAG